MRFSQGIDTVLSEDESSSPKQIQFQDNTSFVDAGASLILKDGGGRTETIPTGTSDYALAMGNIAAGKWYYLRGDADFDLKIDGGAARRMIGGFTSSVFMEYAALTISTVGASDLRLTWAIAGD
jgi:hypothetical protein